MVLSSSQSMFEKYAEDPCSGACFNFRPRSMVSGVGKMR